MERTIKPAGKVFRDPIHNLIRIDRGDELVLELIDTPEFQRLRRIRQLGISCLTYHGAEHSRFVHSLGVYNFAQRILQQLISRYRGNEVQSYLEDHALTVKCAALLHDVGHGPFSHMIERAFSGADHEKRTVEIIQNESSSISKLLGDRAVDVAGIIEHATPHTLLSDIISSQLDADRMDYLLRDSHHTGVQYGLYDADWIINAMCVGLDPGYSPSDSAIKKWRLCLDATRGQDAAEQFILARNHMNAQVYFHRVTRGYEVLLLNLFSHAAKLAKSGELPHETPEVVSIFLKNEGELLLEDWLRFDESSMVASFHAWARPGLGVDPDLARMASAFLNRERLYDSVMIDNIKPSEWLRLGARLGEAGLRLGLDWGIDDISSTVYKGLVQQSSGTNDDPGGAVESILVADGKPSHRAKHVEATSRLMRDLDSQALVVRRLYFDRAKKAQFEAVPGFPNPKC